MVLYTFHGPICCLLLSFSNIVIMSQCIWSVWLQAKQPLVQETSMWVRKEWVGLFAIGLIYNMCFGKSIELDYKYSRSRKPRLFYISTSSTTSTLTTNSVCFVTTATGFLTTACARRKRTIRIDGDMSALEISPTRHDRYDY